MFWSVGSPYPTVQAQSFPGTLTILNSALNPYPSTSPSISITGDGSQTNVLSAGNVLATNANGGTFAASAWISPTPVSDTQWKVRTIADMDQDGHPDLVWQHTSTGGLAIWFMAGTQRVSTGTISASVLDPAWVLAAAADVDGDSYPDFLWHNTTTGELVVWYMRNASIVGVSALTPDRLSDTNWRLRGAIDLDRNGSPDLIWQNIATDDVAAWLMNGTIVIGGQWLGPALGTSVGVMLVLRLVAGARWAPLAAALALAAGVCVGNELRQREPFPIQLEADRPLNTRDVALVFGWSLEGKPPPKAQETEEPSAAVSEDEPALAKPRFWLPYLAA